MVSSETDSNSRPLSRSVRKWIVVAAVLALAIAGYFSWRARSGESTQSAQQPQRPPVVVAAAKRPPETKTKPPGVGRLPLAEVVVLVTSGLIRCSEPDNERSSHER